MTGNHNGTGVIYKLILKNKLCTYHSMPISKLYIYLAITVVWNE